MNAPEVMMTAPSHLLPKLKNTNRQEAIGTFIPFMYRYSPNIFQLSPSIARKSAILDNSRRKTFLVDPDGFSKQTFPEPSKHDEVFSFQSHSGNGHASDGGCNAYFSKE
jgi:hypothetical protein